MIANKLREFANTILLEGPGRRKTLEQWAVTLIASGDALAARVRAAQGDEARNRAILNHIIGIERWSQRRLRVFLGQPPVRDEYDGYRPSAQLSLMEQLALFETARAQTVEIVRQIGDIPKEARPTTVAHNQHGPLSIFAWIRYLDMHAAWESRRIR